MNIYICASFCYEDKAKTSERKYLIEKTAERIKKAILDQYDPEHPGRSIYKGEGINMYLPHQLTIPNAWDISMEEWAKAVYNEDIKKLIGANLVVFLSFGKENNAGSVWEVGYITGRNQFIEPEHEIPVVMVKMTDEIESLMLTNSLDKIITEKEIETYCWASLPYYKTRLEKLS